MSRPPLELTGIAWDHSRAYPPLVAAAQRYEELHPGEVRIRWEKRSLHEFGHLPITSLADRFDLIVIDHPWAGECFARGLVHDLKEMLERETWTDLATNCVGPAFESYHYDGRLLAVPIDAATPAPSWRPDLLEKAGCGVPRRWGDLVELADRGLAVMPGFAADLFLNWLMLLEALGARPWAAPGRMVEREPALAAIALLARLARGMPDAIFDWNPIAIAERMTCGDGIACCAFAYSYGNYCRPAFSRHPLRYGELVMLDDGTPLRSIVGGTGIAISAHCREVGRALDFALFCARPEIQAGLYTHAGGQPVRREAWDDPRLDEFSGGFFTSARQPHEQALVRPRYAGYVPLQEAAGIPLQRCLRGEVSPADTLAEIDRYYRESRAA
jgi:multiple sugar transport system substrate-binding protein